MIHRFLFLLGFIAFGPASYAADAGDLAKADEIAREVAQWFTYTTGPMPSDRLGQCGDYALMFALMYNDSKQADVARLVVANNPIPSGTYRIEGEVDIDSLGIPGFDWDSI